ncbi:MAG TPA: VOC family protein, partial [Candidatus Dormibacteraeota bacterium]|nr:VOC family protein [Candidatus Dormibacteraeota bacterium]
KSCLAVNSHQRIDLHIASASVDGNLLEEVTFETSNAEQLHSYLVGNGIAVGEIHDVPKFNRYFSLTDPEGHHIGFIQYLSADDHSDGAAQISSRIIHAGLVVHDRAAEDHFYKDILGFRPYWHGGTKEGEDKWVSMQVPNGTDWIEYMLNVPANADKHLLGVMNHIALGVSDIYAAQGGLTRNGWKPGEQPKIGRDGKWQLNLYDPNGTRVEFMEFNPVQKPCCSEFTGPHPGPQSQLKAPAKP